MKKGFLLILLLMATTSFAQTVLWNGEDKEAGTDGGFWNRSTPTVVEEDGNKCLRITLADAANDWERHNVGLPLGSIDLKGLRRISIRIKMPDAHNVLVKLGKDGSYTLNRLFWYGEANTWQTLVFDYSVGPDNDKVVDTENTVLEIWPYENYNADNNGKNVYIDDILLEGPMVDGVAVRTLADGSLTGKQVIVTGSLKKGNYQNTWDGDWHTEAYDDYSLLLSKLSRDVCFLNLIGAAVADGDGPQLRTKNPNLMILSPVDFFDTDHVIRWDGEKNTTPKLVLDEAYPFYTPIDFHADAVKVTRNLQTGINTLCLPFYVGQAEISTNCKIATYTSSTASAVNFTYTDHADANIPFLATAVDAAVTELNFTDKGIVNTPESLGAPFAGIYTPQSATGKYGINDDGKFQEGGSSATINSFHALLTTIPAGAREVTFNNGTGISNLSIKNPTQTIYNLNGVRVNKLSNKGIYIINGKKVIVK
ncbi:MAG: hypothetical protein IJV17_03995 [Prevotella sp.]|nr:hypothetical protein [Prevotella sp.]